MGCTACHYLFLTAQIEAIFNPLVGLKLKCLAKKRLDKARIFFVKRKRSDVSELFKLISFLRYDISIFIQTYGSLFKI